MAAPFRSCDHCGKPAVVHNTVIVNGKVIEHHLCEEHAAAVTGQPVGPVPINALLGQLAQGGAARARGPTCPSCGLTFHDFKSTGLLGCARCYDTFAATLVPVLERAHGGATQHVGRVPPAGDATIKHRNEQLERLARELGAAVAAERYEEAARLRDMIHALRPQAPDAPGTGSAGAAPPRGSVP
jgi:protein arginine kinase activator